MNQQSERIVGIKATLKELSVSASQIAESSGSVLHIAEKNLENPKKESNNQLRPSIKPH